MSCCRSANGFEVKEGEKVMDGDEEGGEKEDEDEGDEGDEEERDNEADKEEGDCTNFVGIGVTLLSLVHQSILKRKYKGKKRERREQGKRQKEER
jgi:hypothetical protein